MDIPWLGQFEYGSEPPQTQDGLPSLDEVMSAMNEVHSAAIAAIRWHPSRGAFNRSARRTTMGRCSEHLPVTAMPRNRVCPTVVSMAIAHFPTIVLDCPDPVDLATFYAEILDWDFGLVDRERAVEMLGMVLNHAASAADVSPVDAQMVTSGAALPTINRFKASLPR